MIFEPFAPFRGQRIPDQVRHRAWETRGAAALRRQVFCDEQGLFDGDDRDAIDDIAIPIVALSTVRRGRRRRRRHGAHPRGGARPLVGLAPRGRPADHRRVGALGAALIRLAVSSAHARGCHTFLGNVQSQNARLFHHLHWRTLERGRSARQAASMMQADLDFYPPFHAPEVGFLSLPKQAA